MSFQKKLLDELEALFVATLYFGLWIGMLLLIKTLVLAEYHIAVHQWSMIIVGALVLAKVVLILEHVPMPGWIRKRAALLDVEQRVFLSAGTAYMNVVRDQAVAKAQPAVPAPAPRTWRLVTKP